MRDVRYINPLPVPQDFPWERHAPAWLPEPGWSPVFPGGTTGAGLAQWTSSVMEPQRFSISQEVPYA